MNQPDWFAFLRLLRLPTVFTALADIFLGFLLTHATFVNDATMKLDESFLWLCAASAGIYLAGMVFNDFFDRLVDAVERPNRPIPSGGVSPGAALRLASGLMLVGLVAAGFVGGPSLIVAFALSVLVLAYDGGMKRTPFGPLVMGSCRCGNVLLGASASGALSDVIAMPQLPIAAGLGIYIIGVTLFAKQEAEVSRRGALMLAAAVINAGVLTLAYFVHRHGIEINQSRALAILAVILFTINRRLFSAISDPAPQRVQFAIKILLLSLVMLDATMIYAFNGREELAMLTAGLVIPAYWLGRLIPMT